MADQEKIIQAEGIKVSTPDGGKASDVYGGYPYSLQYSINFQEPSKMTVHFVSEDGTYNETGLQQRIFPGKGKSNPMANTPDVDSGGAITYDTISFGSETFNMHPMKYTITDGAEGRFLKIDYYDRSIGYLDKVIVALKGKHLPPSYQPKYMSNYSINTNIDRAPGGIPTSEYIIALGNSYLPKSVSQESGTLPKPKKNQDSAYLCPEYLYSPYELYLGITRNPKMQGMFDPTSLGLLWWYGKFAVAGQDGLNWGNNKDSEDPDALYLKDFHGTLREVLLRWGEIFGFMFYWESQKGVDKLKLMDLRNGTAFADISKTVDTLTKPGSLSNVINISKSYSITDTFSRGAAAYLCQEGRENQTTFTTSFKYLDLLTLPIWRCTTRTGKGRPEYSAAASSDCDLYDMGTRDAIAGESKRFYLPNFCEKECKDNTQGCDYENPFQMIKTSTIRSNHKIEMEGDKAKPSGPGLLASYVRLLKAALIGPEFYRTYVLLKKSNAYANSAFSSTSDYKGVDLNSINNYTFDINDLPDGVGFHTPEVDGGVTDDNQIVNYIYPSGGGDGFKNSLGYFNLLCYPNPSNRADGTSGFAADNLEKHNKMNSFNYTIGRDCISLQRVASKQFEQLLFNDDRIRQAMGVSSADEDKRGSGNDRTKHFNIYRLKKYGNTQLIQEPQEDHIYQLLRSIARHQGQFYYHAGLITQEEMAARNYSDGSITWLHKDLCVNDSPLGPLQDGVDPLAEERKKEMSTTCVGFKNRDSNQRDAYNKKFSKGNLANFTVEQFIQQVYAETITGLDPEKGAVLAITGLSEPHKGIMGIEVIDGGEGYKDGTLAVKFNGDSDFDASATATVVNGIVTMVVVDDPGQGYDEKVSASVEGFTGQGKGGNYNVFGNKIDCDDDEGSGRQCHDCITSSNLALRNNQYKSGIKKGGKTICTPPDAKGILLRDFGPNIANIPANVADQIDRFSKGFYVIPATHPCDIVRFHNEASMQLLILPSVGEAGTGGVTLGGKYAAKDELDWILDQVSIPNLDLALMESTKERTKPKKGLNSFIGITSKDDATVRTKDKIAYQATWMGRGPKFEQSAMVEPIFTANVAAVQFSEVKPTPGDLGVEDAECMTAAERSKKIKKDQKKMKENIRNYAEMYAFHEGNVEFNTRLRVMGDGIKDSGGANIVLDVADGLEGISAMVDGNGIIFEYTVGTRRKKHLLSKPNSNLWMQVKPELFNNVFDI